MSGWRSVSAGVGLLALTAWLSLGGELSELYALEEPDDGGGVAARGEQSTGNPAESVGAPPKAAPDLTGPAANKTETAPKMYELERMTVYGNTVD